MSNIIKLKKKPGGLKAIIPGSGVEFEEFNAGISPEESFKKELELKYENGYKEGYNKARSELEKEFTEELIQKTEEFYKILSSFEEKLSDYETSFDEVVIEVSKIVAQKIIEREISLETSVEKTIKKAVQKVLGANEVKIKVNPDDFNILNDGDRDDLNKYGFNKLKIEPDESIEKGGCYIETEIGNIDGRTGSQLSEIYKQLNNILLNTGE